MNERCGNVPRTVSGTEEVCRKSLLSLILNKVTPGELEKKQMFVTQQSK